MSCQPFVDPISECPDHPILPAALQALVQELEHLRDRVQ